MKHNIFIKNKISLFIVFAIWMFGNNPNISQGAVPRPDHVVICLLENHCYNQIIGTLDAPYINSLVPQSANLQEFYALTHPSQPNMLMLFSGDDHGVIDDTPPAGTPWNTPNLGSALLNAGYTFKGYSEDLPYIGSLAITSSHYARKHNPWSNWQGTGVNQIPSNLNMTLNDFPTNYNLLPNVSFVIPNLINDMHDGTDPARILAGDTWIQNHLQAYINWAQSNNSLFILTFDEDNSLGTNQIPFLLIGPMVRTGNFSSNGYDLYDLLRTFEDMYNLPYIGQSAFATPIEEVWLINPLGIENQPQQTKNSISVFPNPVTVNSNISIDGNIDPENGPIHMLIYDVTGREVQDELITYTSGQRNYPFKSEGLSEGLFTYMVRNESEIIGKGKIVIE